MKAWTWVAAAMLFATTHGATADSRRPAAYEKGDFSAALNEWRPLAEQGDADAQFYLGFMHLQRLRTPRDYARAIKGIAPPPHRATPMRSIALERCIDGQGTAQDYAQAIKWFPPLPSRVTLTRSTPLGRCIGTAKARRKTTRRPSSGIAPPWSTVSPGHSSIWASCMNAA